MFTNLAKLDVLRISLVRQCLSLEEEFGTDCTITCLENARDSPGVVATLTDTLVSAASKITLGRAEEHHSLKYFMQVNQSFGWMKLWDWALDFGVRGTKASQNILKHITKPLFSDRLCVTCGATIPDDSIHFDHRASGDCLAPPFDITELLSSIGSERIFIFSQYLYD